MFRFAVKQENKTTSEPTSEDSVLIRHFPMIDEVDATIVPEDDMTIGLTSEQYLNTGKTVLENIVKAIDSSYQQGFRHPIKRILDFPSGYGRVTRWLVAYFPEARITACDTNAKAVDAAVKQFGVRGMYSQYDLTKIKLPDKNYNLIWCGSLFTHFDKTRFRQLLDLFHRNLAGGDINLYNAWSKSC